MEWRGPARDTYLQFPLRSRGGRLGPAGVGAWRKVPAHLVEGKQVSQVRQLFQSQAIRAPLPST